MSGAAFGSGPVLPGVGVGSGLVLSLVEDVPEAGRAEKAEFVGWVGCPAGLAGPAPGY